MDRIDVDVTLTIPTTTPLSSYGDDLDTWAEMVMREYGDKISAFEIGNEYWSFMGETEYGQRANIAVQALARGIDAAGVEEADIIVQMASTYNESEYTPSRSSVGFIDRLTAANNTIIDQFSTLHLRKLTGLSSIITGTNSRSLTKIILAKSTTWMWTSTFGKAASARTWIFTLPNGT